MYIVYINNIYTGIRGGIKLANKIIVVITTTLVGFMLGYIAHKPVTTVVTNEDITTKTVINEVIPKDTVLHISLDDIYNDLKSYSHLSSKHSDLVITTIAQVSDKYQINPLILYSLIHAESSFRWWLIHDIPKTKDKDPAIGLGGIRYSIWGEQLKEAGVLEVKADLFDIVPNINAIGFIYDHYRKQALHPKATHPDMSALLRYFGGGYLSYFQRIDDKVTSLIKAKIYKENQ